MMSGARLAFAPLAAALGLAALPALASNPFLGTLTDEEARTAPAQRHAALERDDALRELERLGVAFTKVPSDEAPGVDAPIRLTDKLNGVSFHGMVKPTARKTSPFEIVDARLALALHDFARLLREHDIVEVTHYSMYRPPARPRTAKQPVPPARSKDTAGTRGSHGAKTLPAVLPTKPAQKPAQKPARHPAGLAIDAATFTKADGTKLDVLRDFDGQLGQKTCGEGAPTREAAAAKELRTIACDAMKEHLFTYILTPNFNAEHKNHFHMEVKAGVKWFLVH